LTDEDRQTAVDWLRGLRLRIDQDASSLAWSRLSELAVMHQLSVYDAAYLELALRRRLVLGCKDSPLRTAAKRAGARLWDERE
jgi:predicted nucleic acid-binding protein